MLSIVAIDPDTISPDDQPPVAGVVPRADSLGTETLVALRHVRHGRARAGHGLPRTSPTPPSPPIHRDPDARALPGMSTQT